MVKKYKRILIMTAVEVEREAVLVGLEANNSFEVAIAGVGPASAAARTASQLATEDYDLVISAGIGGGFAGKAPLESIVVAKEIIAADLGAETGEGFSSVEELGFGSSKIAVDSRLVEKVTKAMEGTELSVNNGSILTLSTVTGTLETALQLQARFPDAAAEAMEGFGVATAAKDREIPILEIRAISNPIGPRDREAWRIKEALQSLRKACSVLPEVLT
ncbi:futalosine hydrolase [Evansella vedderi]|uniref:Futalosine hydrolase n=1 Tax=Evansella vedderi TaxID=38282 RepID=A0ABU0A133_9BACI|nr:futalosine hydrolase [Evansella vedderi]MDQ0256839.1 futalosine hydrolase [Evansella vedderi]